MRVRTKPTHISISLRRGAFSLIELLVVISIVGVLMALLFPAINSAREAGRQVSCKSNLRQFGVGMCARADKLGTYCSGAFDWQRDGAVTEVGWVADLVNAGIPVGKMNCSSNPAQVNATYTDLLNLDTRSLPIFANPALMLGSPVTAAPDGSAIANPCRQIMAASMPPGSTQRVQVVQSQIFNKFYNTNYTASWWLVRTGVLLDKSGNLLSTVAGCPPSQDLRQSTLGPLSLTNASVGTVSASFLPLLACGGSAGSLSASMGVNSAGSQTAMSFTPGPVVNPTMQPVGRFPPGTPMTGPAGWWAAWNNTTLQDFRGFAPVHKGACNILMADGSAQTFYDANNDHLLNDGFLPTPQNHYADKAAELPPEEVYGRWSLRP
jgi:prepilin-type N-terminal cleavage/methylation domain-containing protein/prepilin-type processing-associated H-X9-DG protein